MDSEMTRTHADQPQLESEISLLDVASAVVRRRRLILGPVLMGALLATVVAWRAPVEYTATGSFLPHGGAQGGFSGASVLAQQFGFSLPTSSAERSPEFYQDLLGSRAILDGVARSGIVNVVTPTKRIAVDLGKRFGISEESTADEVARTRRYLAFVSSAAVARGTGVVTVSVRTGDPELSAAIARRLVELVTAFDVGTRQSQASAERSFAEGRLGELEVQLATAEDSLKSFLAENRQFSNSPQLQFEHDGLQRQVFMRQELVTAMAQAYEQARIDEVRNAPLITLIDEPIPPSRPDGRQTQTTILLGLVLGMMVGLGLAYVGEVGDRAKSDESQAFGGLQDALKDARRDLFGFRRSGRSAGKQ